MMGSSADDGRPPAWHVLTAEEVLQRLGSTELGLTEPEARARLARLGPNDLRPPGQTPAWAILIGQVRSVVVLLLATAAGVALLNGDTTDAVAIGAVLVLNVLIGFVTELRARRAISGLLALQVPRASVVREGRIREIDARELVPGDVIAVEAGQAVPADARLTRGAGLRVVEAPLTGESVPADKRADAKLAATTPLPDRETMVYQGTMVVAGSARAVVVATGAATQVGQIQALIEGIAAGPTPLERRLRALGTRLALAAIGAGVIIAVILLLNGMSLALVVETGIAVAVAAVPESLPAVVTAAMAVGVWRMARRRALVRRLPVVETLGSTTVICTDKTGTLTAGTQVVTTLWVAGREFTITGSGYEPQGALLEHGAPIRGDAPDALRQLVRIAALSSRADVVHSGHGSEVRGDPTDAALVVLGRKAGVERERELGVWPEIGELPFDSQRMLMASYHRRADGQAMAFVKGAPHRVIEASERRITADDSEPLGEAGRQALLAQNRELAARGLRVIALAYGDMPTADGGLPSALTFVGFVGITDPPAPGVKETIRRFRGAGIRTVMLTGDQRLTAEAIARALDVLGPNDTSLDGAELEHMTDATLDARAEHAAVYSRMSPRAKLRVIGALQRRGEIVAMLGDGVNDAAALQQANIGVAMGRRGTDAAKQAAGIVLADDRFQTIGVAVEEGRIVSENIRKFVFYLFSCNAGELLVLLSAGATGLPLPLLPLQILWLNLVTDTFPALALALEPAEPGLMERPPRSPRSGLLSARMLRSTLLYATLIAGVTLAALLWGMRGAAGDESRITTLSFMTLALAQLFHLGTARATSPVTTPGRALANPFALGAVAITLALQLLAVSYAPLTRILALRRLTVQEWILVVALAVIPAIVGQVLRNRGRSTRAIASA
jgi:Ca2+-transporting ATPase